jgi:hypothetical protein
VTPSSDDAGMENSKPLGVLHVRAWLHDQSLVARVIRTPDVETVDPITVVVASPRQLHHEVARWLHDLGVNGSEDWESEDD